MKVVLFGATGMVGAGVLLACLDDPRVESIPAVGGSAERILHPREINALAESLASR